MTQTTDPLTLDPESYMQVLRSAFDKHYSEQSDVWSRDQEMRVTPSLIQGYLKLPASTRALDVGCGAGLDTLYFSEIFSHAVGIDIYQHELWRDFANNDRLRFHRTDLLGYSSDEEFDLVLDNGCFHHQHPDSYIDYFTKLQCVMAADATLVLSTFKNPDLDHLIDDNGRLHRYFSDDELHSVLRTNGFTVFHELDLLRRVKQDYYRITFARACSE